MWRKGTAFIGRVDVRRRWERGRITICICIWASWHGECLGEVRWGWGRLGKEEGAPPVTVDHPPVGELLWITLCAQCLMWGVCVWNYVWICNWICIWTCIWPCIWTFIWICILVLSSNLYFNLNMNMRFYLDLYSNFTSVCIWICISICIWVCNLN